MSVTIQIRRVIPSAKLATVIPLLQQIRALASYQSGHFYSEVLCDPETPEISIEYTTWRNMAAWQAWETSQEWRQTQARIEDMLESKTEYEVMSIAAG